MREATVDGVREVIRENVYDPEIGINIVDLGLVYEILVPGGQVVELNMTLTSPACPIGPQIIRGVQTFLQQAYPDLEAINIHLVWDPLWDPSMMSQNAKDELGFY
jgi:metal-sulfur cluster biosynthetic enzyme